MESLSELESLQSISVDESAYPQNWEDLCAELPGFDSGLFGAESAVSVEIATMGMFDAHNVSDDLVQAHQEAYPNVDQSLEEHYSELLARGPNSVEGLVSGVKGKVAEHRLTDQLEEEFPEHDFEIAEDPTQPVWDVRGVSEEGADVLVQVKMNSDASASEVIDKMQANPDVHYQVSEELHASITESNPELGDQLINSEISNLEFTQDIQEGMGLLAENLGIDVPDEVGEILPYATEIMLALKLIKDIVDTKKDFEGVDLSNRKRINVMKALVLIQRFGISTVLTTAAGTAGTAVFPGIGTLVGAASGAGLSWFLSKKLKPRMMEVALKVSGLEQEDMFYFKNKMAIDDLAQSFYDMREATTQKYLA